MANQARGEVVEAWDGDSLVRSSFADAPWGAGPLSTVTIEDLLRIPIVAGGRPDVLAGRQNLGRRIRWIHVSELADPSGLLQGGEFILSTGIALPQSAKELEQYVDVLVEQHVVGLGIELGRRWRELPRELVRACVRRDLPLVVFRREVAFVKITEAVHSRIIMGQRQILQVAELAHERFTELSLADASVSEFVAVAGELAKGDVVFSGPFKHAIAVRALHGSVEETLRRWSRNVQLWTGKFGTRVDDVEGIAVTPVEVRGFVRGHFALFCPEAPTPGQVLVLERAAAALAIRLLREDDRTVLAEAERSVLVDILAGKSASVEAIHARASAIGRHTRVRRYLPLAVLGNQADLGDVIRGALDHCSTDGLVARLREERWAVLLLLEPCHDSGMLERFSARLHEAQPDAGVVVAQGSVVGNLADVRRSFNEALDVALSIEACQPFVTPKTTYGAQDMQLRELLYSLREDPRVQVFVESRVTPLLQRDEGERGEFVQTLLAYLEFRGNKSLTAQKLGIARPTLYDRLARVERLLGIDLDDPEASASLHAALMVAEVSVYQGGLNLGRRAESSRKPNDLHVVRNES